MGETWSQQVSRPYCTVEIWINEERLGRLQDIGLAELAEEVLAGMRVLRIPCAEVEARELLGQCPAAKHDAATTGTIELLPPAVKSALFELVVRHGSLDVVRDYLNDVSAESD